MAKFSVIIPIYNVEPFLHKCVDSLLAQAYEDVEIILVDDGSPDNCSAICDTYAQKDSRVKVIHKPNGGLVSARQAGCEVATGEYILNVDGDDWVMPDYFEKISAIAQQYAPDCICFGAIHVRDDYAAEHPLSDHDQQYDKQAICERIFPKLIENITGKYYSPTIWSKAIKRELYTPEQLAVDKRIKIGEDHACTKPILYKCDTLYIMKECLYCYRLNPLSMTKNKKAFSFDGPELIAKHFEARLPMDQYDFQDQVYRSVVHNMFNVAVSQFHRKEKYRDICRDVDAHLSQPYYKNAIKRCKYKGWRGISAKLALQYRLYFLMKLKAR